MDTQPQPSEKLDKSAVLPASFEGGLSSPDVALPHYRRSKIVLTIIVILLLALLLGAALAFSQRFSIGSLRLSLPAAVGFAERATPIPVAATVPVGALDDLTVGDSWHDIESDIAQTLLGDLDTEIKDLDTQAASN